MATAGDVGRPKAALMSSFPQLAGPLSELNELWWYEGGTSKRRSCAITQVLGALEPRSSCQRRVNEFNRWISARPEKFIVCFGHCMFWEMFTKEAKMKNCDVLVRYW
ncbi:MAG: hypothetical protein WDW38_008886 [Sanguina aurantia]